VEAEILPQLNLTPTAAQVLLEAIELHDYRDFRQPKSAEALLLREADMLEFLGMMGMAREFARGPKDVAVCYRRILDRRAGIEGRFSLPRACEIAQTRLERMSQCLDWLQKKVLGSCKPNYPNPSSPKISLSVRLLTLPPSSSSQKRWS
jgi:hypothetical protein